MKRDEFVALNKLLKKFKSVADSNDVITLDGMIVLTDQIVLSYQESDK